ncbi:MAG: VCBS repeat-containing protein [Spartobacteria bacterium]|nr:VCBS repeat-containing protein [Spartobacteria bacterium]
MRFKSGCLSVFVLLWVILPLSQAQSTTDWSIDVTKIKVNGGDFIVNGIDYSPIPIGSCYGCVQGSGDVFTKDWRAVYFRDLPYLRALGANVVRTYGWTAYAHSDQNIQNWSSLDWSASSTSANDHIEFLDECWNGGANPVYVIIGFGVTIPNLMEPAGDKDNYRAWWSNTVAWSCEKYGAHPAVMGFCIGNEQNNPDRLGQNGWNTECSNYWFVCDMLGSIVTSKAPTKLVGQAWQFSTGASPFTPGHTDYQAVKDSQIFDFWGLNLYGQFGSFFNDYSNYVDQATNAKPIILTEFGTTVAYHNPTNACGLTNECTAYTTSDSIAWAANVISNNIAALQANTAVCAGGCIMEWCDEWWKEEGRLPNQENYLQEADCQDGAYTPSGYWDEEWWGLCEVRVAGGRDPQVPWNTNYAQPNPPDILIPRATYTMVQGMWGGTPIPSPYVRVVLTNMTGHLAMPYYWPVQGGNPINLVAFPGLEKGAALEVYLPRNATNLGVAAQISGSEWPQVCAVSASEIANLSDGESIQLVVNYGNCPCGDDPATGGLHLFVTNPLPVMVSPQYKVAGHSDWNTMNIDGDPTNHNIAAGAKGQISLPTNAVEFGIWYAPWEVVGCTLSQAEIAQFKDGDIIQAAKSGDCAGGQTIQLFVTNELDVVASPQYKIAGDETWHTLAINGDGDTHNIEPGAVGQIDLPDSAVEFGIWYAPWYAVGCTLKQSVIAELKDGTTIKAAKQDSCYCGLSAANDFTGDGQSDLAVYHPETGVWTIGQLTNTDVSARSIPLFGFNPFMFFFDIIWGWTQSIPVAADYNGDGKTDVSVFEPLTGMWHLHHVGEDTDRAVSWGWFGVIPVPGDYDGDRMEDIAIFDPTEGRWFILYTGGCVAIIDWGWSEAIPVPYDYDGDAKTDVAVYWPQNGTWYIRQSLDLSLRTQNWGWSEAVPAPADYDGDGMGDLAVYHPESGNWYIRNSGDHSSEVINWGWSEAVPVPAHYNEDADSDLAVYDLNTGDWYIRYEYGPIVERKMFPWGSGEHVPVSLQYQINQLKGLLP